MKFNQIEARTLRERIYNQVRQGILFGEILPGQSIKLNSLAKQFNVSVMPVREALFQLHSEKAIVIERSKSFRVNALTPIEMEEVLRIRLMLEIEAAQRACEFRPESALSELRLLLKKLRNSAQNPKKYMKINSQFHLHLYSYARSQMLLQMIDLLWVRFSPYFFIYFKDVDFLAQTIDTHQEMFEAFSKKDKEKIKDAISRDLESSAQHLIPLIGISTQTNTTQ